jgi:2,3-bisphosphoglycerate-independent phosphoglycerate mutase
MHKARLVVMDGWGDRPVRELGGLTPLKTAHLLLVTADHSTPGIPKKHSGDPMPIMMAGDCLAHPADRRLNCCGEDRR